MADTLAVIQQGARTALLAAGDEFDPSFVFAGVLQPTLLGIPLGEPETEVQVTIDKNNIGFVATGSIIEALKDQVGMYTFSGDLAGGLFALPTLNTTDRVTFGVQIPVPDLRSLLLDGGSFEPIDPEQTSTQFAVTIEGDLTVAGMTMSVGGFFTAPNNANFVDTLVQKRFELPAEHAGRSGSGADHQGSRLRQSDRTRWSDALRPTAGAPTWSPTRSVSRSACQTFPRTSPAHLPGSTSSAPR